MRPIRNRKAAEDTQRSHTELSGNLAESLAALISRQMEAGFEAVKCRQNELAALVACQLFDAIDWARLNVSKESLATLDMRVLALMKSGQEFRTLEELESYAETHFVGKG